MKLNHNIIQIIMIKFFVDERKNLFFVKFFINETSL